MCYQQYALRISGNVVGHPCGKKEDAPFRQVVELSACRKARVANNRLNNNRPANMVWRNVSLGLNVEKEYLQPLGRRNRLLPSLCCAANLG